MLNFVEKPTKLVYKVSKRKEKTRDEKIKVEYPSLFNRLVSFTESVEKFL